MRSEGYSSRSVCLSVYLSTTILALQATRRLMSDTNSFSATRAWREKQAKKPICIMSAGLPRPGSAHRGRIKLLRGYVSKSSAALNPLTITQLAYELSMRGRLRTRTALFGPSHQLAVRMRIMRIIVPRSVYTFACIACV